MSKSIKEPVLCPHCGYDTYRWGHAINSRDLQRYRCKAQKCRHQFTSGRPQRVKKASYNALP